MPYICTIFYYTITVPIFLCGFHAVLTQALPSRQVQWHQKFSFSGSPRCPQKRWSLHWMTPKKNNPLVIQSDLFGMVKWPFGKVKWPPTGGWKGHFESPGLLLLTVDTLPVWKRRAGKSHRFTVRFPRTVHLLWGFPRPKSPGINKNSEEPLTGGSTHDRRKKILQNTADGRNPASVNV